MWIDDFWLLALSFIPMVMASALMNTVANSTLTKKVPESATGNESLSINNYIEAIKHYTILLLFLAHTRHYLTCYCIR